MIPPNPINERETMEAAIRVMGSPCNLLGILSLPSRTERTPAKSIIARRKPSPQPRAEKMDSMKLYPSEILLIVTPRTAQFVVIRGRYTPSDL